MTRYGEGGGLPAGPAKRCPSCEGSSSHLTGDRLLSQTEWILDEALGLLDIHVVHSKRPLGIACQFICVLVHFYLDTTKREGRMLDMMNATQTSGSRENDSYREPANYARPETTLARPTLPTGRLLPLVSARARVFYVDGSIP